MCTPNTELQFCTCADEIELTTNNIYVWKLYRYIGSKESRLVGKILIPIVDFENGISVENIISKLNYGNIFDFDYSPSERDSIHISYNAEYHFEYKYFELIYKKGKWREGGNPFFTSIEETIAKGEIKVIYKDENFFIRQCESIKSNFGITIPELIKVRCANLAEDSQEPIYLAIKNFKGYKIFYKDDYIKKVFKSYFRIYPSENSEKLQAMLDEAQNKFSLLEKKFVSETENLSFLNRCFNDLKKDIDTCFFITIPFENKREFLIVNGHLVGRTGYKINRYDTHGKSSSKKIKYEVFNLYYS